MTTGMRSVTVHASYEPPWAVGQLQLLPEHNPHA